MVIHFICRGNTHRSRLAAAYARSCTRDLDEVTILSSGIEADRNLNGPIVPFVKLLLQKENLLQFAGTSWTQTSQTLIADSDVLIFMSADVYEDATQRFDIPLAISRTWQIPDEQGVDGKIKSAVEGLLSELKILRPGP
jgi:protein-tyrosine-phosphatase